MSHYTGSFWLFSYAFILYKFLEYSGSPPLNLWAEEQKLWIHEIKDGDIIVLTETWCQNDLLTHCPPGYIEVMVTSVKLKNMHKGRTGGYCDICTIYNKTGKTMHKSNKCTKYQHSTITRHVLSKDHQSCLSIPALQKDLEPSQMKVDSQQDKAALVLFKTTHWMAQEGVPLSKFESLHNLLAEVGVQDLKPLQQKAVSYSSWYIADTVHAALKNKVNESPFVTVLTDESTDITNHKCLVVYVQITDTESFQPSTHSVANKECLDTTGAGIAKCIQEVMSMGSDGAAVMMGRNKGCTGILLWSNPHMVNVHCAAHSLALCISQAAEAIPDLKEHQQKGISSYRPWHDIWKW